jgi:CRISP-associated protein Cas1
MMRRQLNTLYVTTEGAWLHKDGENVVMEVERETRARIPVHMLEGLVCLGRMAVSAQLLGFCAERGITISYLTPNGHFLARVEGPVSGNVLLRREQYRRSDHPQGCAAIVRNMLAGKIHNQRAVLARGWRDHGAKLADTSSFQHALKRLKRIPQRLLVETDVDRLRGLEGEAAQAYFDVFDQLILSEASLLRFNSRTRRPPRDAVNALLSFLYTLLTHDCRSAL